MFFIAASCFAFACVALALALPLAALERVGVCDTLRDALYK